MTSHKVNFVKTGYLSSFMVAQSGKKKNRPQPHDTLCAWRGGRRQSRWDLGIFDGDLHNMALEAAADDDAGSAGFVGPDDKPVGLAARCPATAVFDWLATT